jgi:Uncharacterized conserved protein related to MYG1 family
MTPIRTILTHPGGAHKDEFLACSVLLAIHPVPVVRREPSSRDLADAGVCVVDVGHRLQPELNNFDHHQFPRDHTPTCSLSLVLQHLGLYEDARRFCDWLETAEWFDCRGPIATAVWLGVHKEIMTRLNSPIDMTLLRRFSQSPRLEPGDPLWEVMRMVGEDLLQYIRSLRERLEYLHRHAEWWTLNVGTETKRVLFLPRTEPLFDEPSLGLEQFIEGLGLEDEVAGLVYPDRRGKGYGMSRFQDDKRLDFTRIAGQPEVHFAHARGFLAKTSATEVSRLRELVDQAVV